MSEADKDKLGKKKEQTGDGKEEDGVAEVRDADGRVGRRCAVGVGEEQGLVFGANGRPECWNGDGWFL